MKRKSERDGNIEKCDISYSLSRLYYYTTDYEKYKKILRKIYRKKLAMDSCDIEINLRI